MPKFRVSVTSKVPLLFRAEVEVVAATEDAARARVRAMYANDEIGFEGGEADYDEANLTIVKVKQLPA